VLIARLARRAAAQNAELAISVVAPSPDLTVAVQRQAVVGAGRNLLYVEKASKSGNRYRQVARGRVAVAELAEGVASP
jgi:hypothetical protein